MTLWMRLHGQALAGATERLVSQPLATATAIAAIAIAIALSVLASVVLRSVAALTAGLDTDPHVNVFLALDATAEDAKRVEAALRAHPDVAQVRFVAREAALEELKAATHLAELLASLERNPLPHAFTVRTRTTDPLRIQAMRSQWTRVAKVDQVVADFEWSQRLARWVQFGDRLLMAAALLLALAVVFIVGYQIRLQVLTQRDEIEVSQLIGATAADVRRPFLYHGLLQGLLAGVAAIALAASAAAWLGHELQALTSSYATEFKVVFIDSWIVFGVVAGSATLGLLGAWLSVSRELRRFSVAH